MSISDKVILVTGASRGIGQAIANHLAEQGAHVIGTATSEKGAQSISAQFKANNVKGQGMVLNVNDQTSVEQLLHTLSETCGAPSILVNNAGITKDNLLLRMDDDEWQSVIDTNLTSLYRLTKPCLKAMFKARWGRVINISSIVGSTGNPGQVNYCAAKAGISGFSKALAQEVASRNITVNTVAPGFIDTDMTRALPDNVNDELKKRIPMKRMGNPIDIAYAVSFLASDQAAYITGQTLHVNGGMFMA